LEWDGLWTWYRVEGDLDAEGRAPLVILHGGPGAAHDYVEPIAELTRRSGRASVLYDQIGCGRSQHLPDAGSEFWSVGLFARELRALLAQLGIASATTSSASLGAGCSRWSTRSSTRLGCARSW
jgi:L-proline amide hydrolase